MAFVGGIGTGFIDLGGEVHTTYIDALDFKRAEVSLLQLAGYLEEVENPLLLARKIALDDMKDRFDNETDPEGKKWQELTDVYSEEKQKSVGFEHPILTRGTDSMNRPHQRLRDAATEGHRWTVSTDSIFFSTANLPDYWRAHQEGSGEFETMAIPKFVKGKGMVDSDETHTFRTDGGKGVPQRAFIGISAEAEDKIFDTFDLWFSTGVEKATSNFAVSSSGTLQTRTAGGRFGPKPIIG